jgi:hypothetical protein
MHGKGDRDGAMKSTIVLFLGGCTQTEISALRWMSSQAQGESSDKRIRESTSDESIFFFFFFEGRKYIIATTNIVSGSTVSCIVLDPKAEARKLT